MKYSRVRQFAHNHPMLVRTAGFVAAMGVGLAHAHSTRLPGNVSPAGHWAPIQPPGEPSLYINDRVVSSDDNGRAGRGRSPNKQTALAVLP